MNKPNLTKLIKTFISDRILNSNFNINSNQIENYLKIIITKLENLGLGHTKYQSILLSDHEFNENLTIQRIEFSTLNSFRDVDSDFQYKRFRISPIHLNDILEGQ